MGRWDDVLSRQDAESVRSLERLTEFHADRSRLVYEEPRTTGSFGGDGPIVPKICHLIREILADDCNFEWTIRECKSRVDQPVGAAYTGIAGIIVAAEALADVGVVSATDQVPRAREMRGIRNGCVACPVWDLKHR